MFYNAIRSLKTYPDSTQSPSPLPSPSEGSWRRRGRRRPGSWDWSGQRDQTEARTWSERGGPFSCKCVRWGISASQNTRPRHLSHTWGGLDLACMGGLARGFHIPSMVSCMAQLKPLFLVFAVIPIMEKYVLQRIIDWVLQRCRRESQIEGILLCFYRAVTYRWCRLS